MDGKGNEDSQAGLAGKPRSLGTRQKQGKQTPRGLGVAAHRQPGNGCVPCLKASGRPELPSGGSDLHPNKPWDCYLTPWWEHLGRQHLPAAPAHTGTGGPGWQEAELLLGQATHVKVLGKRHEKGFSESRDSTNAAVLRALPRQVGTGCPTGGWKRLQHNALNQKSRRCRSEYQHLRWSGWKRMRHWKWSNPGRKDFILPDFKKKFLK